MGKGVVVVAGTRPEAIKLGPVVAELDRRGLLAGYVWTGQHYSPGLVGFLAACPWPAPSVVLEPWPAGRGRGWVLTRLVPRLAEVVRGLDPAAVLVQGDTDSGVAGGWAAERLGLPLAHLEAGLRSWDPGQVEERGRRWLDRRAGLLLCPSPLAAAFARVDAPAARVEVVGQTGLEALAEVAERDPAPASDRPWALITLHRSEMVDPPGLLASVLQACLSAVGDQGLRPVWLGHPRAVPVAAEAGLPAPSDPMPYPRLAGIMLHPARRPALVLTDSGGLVEEAYAAGIPCAVLRPSTERWEPVAEGRAAMVPPRRAADMLPGVAAGLAALRLDAPTPWGGAYGAAGASRRTVDALAGWVV